MINLGTDESPANTQKDIQKYTKEIKDQNLKIEIEQLKSSIAIYIIYFKDIIPSQFYSEFTFEELLKKNESLSSFKSINKLYLFFTKLIDKNKFKINEENNFYLLKFYYEDKLEDIELEFNIKRKELNKEEENKNFENSINKLSEELNNLKEEFKNYKNNYLNLCWPIDSYYLTNNNINPEKSFGEKWQKIEGKFLYAADNNRKVDSTGGQEKVTLTIDEMPSHDHIPQEGESYLNPSHYCYKSFNGYFSGYLNGSSASFTKTFPAGGNQPHENMPPYIAAFCWKRLE